MVDAMPAVDVAAAARRIAPYVRVTPVVHAAIAGIDDVALKLEQLQVTGSFKARGAFNALLCREVGRAGVVAASGGNHGAAVAFAAQRLGHRAQVFVPDFCPPAKLERLRAYGAEVVSVDGEYADAVVAAEQAAERPGAVSVHAYDDPEVVAGQATLGLELGAQAAFDTVLVAVGGGGLAGGIASTLALSQRLVAVEPETAPTLHTALARGEPCEVAIGGVARDSLGARRVGTLPFTLLRDATSVLVPDEAITAAQQLLWDELRVAAEPGGATAVAALLCRAYVPQPGERLAVIVSGANISR